MPDNSDTTKLAVLEDWRERVDQQLNDIITSVHDGNQALSQQIAALDKKFAAKWVQTVVAGLITAILLAFIGALTAIVFHTTFTTPPHTVITSSK
jgi:hypothetical protein